MAGWTLAGIHHLGLTVRDLERSIHFYRDLLGMTLVRRRTTDADYIGRQTGFPGVQLSVASFKVAPDSNPSLEIVQYLTHSAVPSEHATNQPGVSHLCLRVDNLGAAYASLRDQGVPFKAEPVAITSGPNQGGVVVYLYDPDGYTLELFEPPVRA